MQIIAFDFDPESGRMVPVTAEVLREQTEFWTLPPSGLTTWEREEWRKGRKFGLSKGMSAEKAWYFASWGIARARGR